jgi:hypothetical protein
MTCGLVWQPNTPGQALVFASGRASPPTTGAGATEFYDVASIGSPGTVTTEANTQQLSPTLPSGGHTLTFGNLYVAQSGAPTSGGATPYRSTTLRAAGATVGPHCQITTTSTGTIGGASGTYFCSDVAGSDAYPVANGAFVDMQTADIGTSGGATLTWLKSTMTAVYQ